MTYNKVMRILCPLPYQQRYCCVLPKYWDTDAEVTPAGRRVGS